MADDFAASISTTGSVGVGGSATGNIETTGDADWFAVSLVAGTTYRFDLEGSDTGQGTLEQPQLELRGSAGNLLLSDSTSGGFDGPGSGWNWRITYTATASGTFYLASDPLGNAIGTYRISATSLGSVADDFAASTSTTGSVGVGGSTTGNIETTGDADWFAVSLVAGTTYRFDLEGSDTGQGTLEQPQLELRGSAGNLLLSDSTSGGFDGPGSGWNSRITYTATASGPFYLASDPLGNAIGTYRIGATSLGSIADDYSASTSTTGSVGVGGSATGNIETTGDADWFAISLVAGTTYRFDLEGSDTGQGTLEQPQLELRGSSGNLLLSDSTSGGFDGPGSGWNSRITHTATASGTFYLASDPLGNAIGTYKLSATSLGGIADDYAATTATTGVVNVGDSATGNIETTGDADWFGVSLVAGTTYRFDLEGSDTGQGTLEQPQLELRGSAGNLLLSDSTSGGFDGPGSGWNSRITYTATASGTFYLASDPAGNAIGTYRISAASLGSVADDYAASISTTGSVGVGGSATGNIETTGDADWFAVSLVAGTTYRFDLEGSDTGQGTLEQPQLELRGSAGNLLLSDSTSGGFDGPGSGWNSRITYTATASGTFYLASDPLGNAIGTYKVSVTSLGVTNHAPTIDSNGGGDAANVSIAENTTVVTVVTALDADPGTMLVYSIAGGVDAAKFQINSSTGLFSFIAAPNFEAPTDADHNNSYIVQVRASDGNLFDDQTITVNVSDVYESLKPPNDFYGDLRSDIFWRTNGGALAVWEMNGDQIGPADYVRNGNAVTGAPGSDWHLVGTDAMPADFDGDGKGDLFWWTDSGAVAIWKMDGSHINGADYTRVGSNAVGRPGSDWHIADTGDFDGNGKADILWRTDSGALAIWKMDGTQISGADYIRMGQTAVAAPGGDWHILGVADFDSDGKGDLLWRTDSGALALWEMDGTQIKAADYLRIGSSPVGRPAADWHIVGTGDFGGDGKADILWQTDSGALAIWDMDGSQIKGADYVRIGSTAVGRPGPDWHIAGTGDFNGDGMADILWRTDGGSLALWQMDGNQIGPAGYLKIGQTNVGAPGTDWNIIQHQYDLL